VSAAAEETPPVETSLTDWLQFIQTEYLEMPGLCLTFEQAQRLWGLDEATCRDLLDALVDARFLRETPRRTFVLDGASV
jgi:DNA-binding IclR family transcriptional regulator